MPEQEQTQEEWITGKTVRTGDEILSYVARHKQAGAVLNRFDGGDLVIILENQRNTSWQAIEKQPCASSIHLHPKYRLVYLSAK